MSGKRLRVLTLNVVESCDAACRYCNWWRVKASHEPLDALVKAVDQAASMGAVAIRISGGEPLLRADFPALVAHIRERGLVSMVCTAAKCEIHSLFTLLDAGLDVLSVSVDTLQPESFRQIRGYDLDPILENLDRLADLRPHANFEIVLSVVVTRLSVDGLPELLEYARTRDFVVSITPFQDATPKGSSPMKALAFRTKDEPHLRQTMWLARQAAIAGVRLINADEFLAGIADFLMTRRLPAGHVCRSGDSTAIRMAGGELKLCHSLDGIRESDIAVSWHSDDARALRERMARLDCPGCWLSCHADPRRPVAHRYGRPEIWEAL